MYIKRLFLPFLFFAITSATSSSVAYSCTTFLINKDGHLVFGRNYDWMTGNGFMSVNLAGLTKKSFDMNDGPLINWTSRYGSITFNQYGREFPNGGMNEKGLVVEIMWLDETRFEPKDQRPSLNVLQWIQYQLDNHATVADVLSSLDKIRISSGGNIPLHYLIADATGDAATIEVLEGKLQVHHRDQLKLPVLTNNTYADSEKYRKSREQVTESKQAFQRNSLERYRRACGLISEYQSGSSQVSPIEQSFRVLEEVSQGNYTKWSITYDITNKEIHFKAADLGVRSISFSKLNMSCPAPGPVYPLQGPDIGDVSGKMVPYQRAFNDAMVRKSLKESERAVQLPEPLVRQLINYPDDITCR